MYLSTNPRLYYDFTQSEFFRSVFRPLVQQKIEDAVPKRVSGIFTSMGNLIEAIIYRQIYDRIMSVASSYRVE